MKHRFVLIALILVSACSLALRPVAAQESGLTVQLTASASKAKVGTFVGYSVVVENTGAANIPAVSVNLGLPDALDARAVNCPGANDGNVTYCDLGDLAPGSVAEVLFIVQVGARNPNGPVTAFVASGDTVLATDQVAPLKIVGPAHRSR